MINKSILHLGSPLDRIGVGQVFNGDAPWDIKIHNYPAMAAAALRGSLGLGEAYMDGVWDCDELDTLFSRLAKHLPNGFTILSQLRGMITNGSKRAAFDVGAQHYSIGNDLYEAMLDRRMTYTCALWDDAGNLDQAQESKLARTARKLELEPGMRVLDIGSGWGSMLGYMRETYDVRATGLTVSKAQAEYANERYNRDGLCETLLKDYRDLAPTTRFDRIVSIGMFEHVGHRAYRTFFERANALLVPGGILLLHTITSPEKHAAPDPWTTTYIFPNSEIPGECAIMAAAESLFRLEHAENLGGKNYDKTLMAWWHYFDHAYKTGRIDNAKYNTRFYRMWQLYLRAAAGNMRAEKMGVHQFKFRKI